MAGKVMKRLLAGLAALLVLAIVVGGFAIYNKHRQNQIDHFRTDLTVMGFGDTKPGWDDDTKKVGGTTKTTSVLEATVIIRGCPFEVERRNDERRVERTVDGRQIRRFEVDEINVGGEEYEIDNFPIYSPTPDQIRAWVDANSGRFPCYNREAA